MDLSKIKLFPHYPDNETVRSDVADYYFEVQRFDSRRRPRRSTLLEEIGELDNTIIVDDRRSRHAVPALQVEPLRLRRHACRWRCAGGRK